MAREPWLAGVYTAAVTAGVRDASGNPLEAEYGWSFTVHSATCAGDCNGDGVVTSAEVQHGASLIFAPSELSSCSSLDADGDGRVGAHEIVRAVKSVAQCGEVERRAARAYRPAGAEVNCSR